MTKTSPFKLETKRSLAEQVADRITELIVDGDAFAASFHESLANVASNPLLGLWIGTLRVLLEEHIRGVIGEIGPVTDVLLYHAASFDAVEARDADAARRAMENHLTKVKENYYSTVSTS
ncbi:MAG: hypothetical protein BMS9Abin12_1866 [Acidimicrobiia bacterium]|nr:MAG: hypothetical protein BMS9Abin12_1866 [Acidimicrobiia bacterium]